MLTQEENRYLIEVGPGKPIGEVFRRFWLPALLMEELPGPDCTPVRVRLLGEDLIAFRDTDGKVGLVDAFCPHRSAPMFFGRNEQSGLRCVYHGWKFDVEGNCTEMPNCVEGETFRNKVRITAYPTFEAAGMVWAYMGPKADMPPRPGWPWLDKPAENVFVTKYLMDCNYLQTLENEFDSSHAQFLHTTLDGRNMSQNMWIKKYDGDPRDRTGQTYNPAFQRVADYRLDATGEIVDTEFGSALVRRMPSPDGSRDAFFLLTPYWMPCMSPGGLSAPGVSMLNIKVPVDDEHSVFFRFKWSDTPIAPNVLAEMKHGGYEFPKQIPGTYRAAQNKSNDYELDRVKQRFFNYSGMVNTPVQDFAVTENQRGPVTDRTQETLSSSDRYLIHVRRRLVNAGRAVERGERLVEPWSGDAFGMRLPRRVELPVGSSLDEALKLLLDPSAPNVVAVERAAAAVPQAR